jgi:hypothetical protein
MDQQRRARQNRHDASARAAEKLKSQVQAQRKRHPAWTTRSIARGILRAHGRPTDDKSINALAARIRRLEVSVRRSSNDGAGRDTRAPSPS